MADQLYNQFADMTELERVRDLILKDIFGKIKDGVTDLNKTTFKIDGANSAADLKKVLEELKLKEKELADQSKRLSDVQSQLATLMATAAQGAKTAGEGYKGFSDQLAVNIQRQIQLKDRLSEIAAELKKLNEFKKAAKDSADFNAQVLKLTAEQKSLQTELAQTNRVINLQSKEISETSTEYDKAAARAEQLKRTLRDLSVAGKEDTVDFTKAKEEFDELDTKLRAADKKVNDYTKNVGNYANSLAGGFDKIAAEISKLKTERDVLNTAQSQRTVIPGFQTQAQQAERLNQVNAALTQLNATAQIGFQTTGNLNQQVRKLEQSYQNMAASGNQSNEFLEEFKQFVAASKDQLEDLRGEIKALSSDTFVFDQLSQGVKFLASTGQVALSIMELMGDKNEDVQKSIQRLIIIQNVANGVQEIANQLTLRGTVLNKAYVFVQNLLTTSLNSSATAAARFQAALGLLGIAVTIIGAIVVAMAAYKRATDNAVSSAGLLKQTLAESNSEYTNAVKNVSELRTNIDLAKQGFLNKKDVVKQYNETIGKTTGEVKNLDEAEQELNKNAEAYIKFTLAKAAAQLALGKAAAEALLLAQKEQDIEQDLVLATKDKPKPKLDSQGRPTITTTDAGEFVEQGTEGEKRLLAEKDRVRSQSNKRIKNFEDIASEFQAQAALISSKFKFNFFGDGTDKESKDAAKKFFSAGLEFQRDALLKISDNEKEFIAKRIAARKAAADIEARIVFGKTKDEIAAAKGNAEQIANIRKAEGIELSRIALKRNDDILKLEEDFYAGLLDRVQKGEALLKEGKKALFEQQTKDAENLFSDNNLDSESFYDRENQLNEAAFKQGKKSAEQYAVDKKKIQTDLNKAQLSAEIIYTKDIIDLRKLQNVDTTEDERKLLKLKQELRNIDVANYEEYAKQIDEINKKLVEDRKAALQKLGDQIKDLFFTGLNSIYDAQINKIHDQIEAIDVLKAAEIDRISSSTDGEEKKAARIKIIEAKAQNDREALERRQRDLEKRKAIVEKAATVFSITLSGIRDVATIKSAAAAAYAKTFATVPPPFNIIAANFAAFNVLKQIPFSIASTAAALAGVLATTPRFWTGTESAPEGLAQVAEKGPELTIDPHGNKRLFEKHTLTYLTRGTKVLNADVTKDIMQAAEVDRKGMMSSYHNNVNVTVPQNKELLEKTDSMISEMRELNKKSRIVIINNAPIESSAWYQQHFKN